MKSVNGKNFNLSPFSDQVASLVYSTAPENYAYQFAGIENLVQVVTEALTRPGLIFSGDAITAFLEGEEVAGMVSAYSGSEYDSRKKVMASLFGGLREKGALSDAFFQLFPQRAKECSYFNPNVPERYYYVFALAVLERHRGQGLGGRLMSAVFDEARASNHLGVHLDVQSDNTAVDFYKSLGFAVVSEIKAETPFLNGVPTHLRMVKVF